MIMEEKKINDSEVIDLRLVAKKIWDNKRLFYKTLPVAFVLSCVYIFSLPRYYTSEVKLAPEMESLSANGTLGTLASSFGFDLSAITQDMLEIEIQWCRDRLPDYFTLVHGIMTVNEVPEKFRDRYLCAETG